MWRAISGLAGGQLGRLLDYTRPYRRLFWLGVAATLLASGLNLVFPRLFGTLVDSSFLKVSHLSQHTLNSTVLLLLLIFALSAAFTGIQSWLLSRVGLSVVADLRRALFSHLLTLSPRFFSEHKTGDLTSRLTADVSTVQVVTSTALAQLISQAFTLVGALVLLVLTSWKLSLLTLVLIPLIIGTALYFGRRIRKVSRRVQDEIAAANAAATEAIGGVRVVQSFTAEHLERERYGQGVLRSFGSALERARLQATASGLMTFLTFGSLALILWYGGLQVMGGQLSPGQLVTFLFYAMQVGSTVASLSALNNQFQEALGASARIFELLDEQSELVQAAVPTERHQIRGELEFQDVSFEYRPGQPILKHLQLCVPAGQVVALVGPSGAGKSSLVSLIPRFWDVSGGQLLLDGEDVRRSSLQSLRRHIGLVPQETLLFSGTIAENILYGRPQATPAEVQAAAQAANAHAFITELPQGYDTVVGERGVKLSGGQRQRVAIARAVLKDPRILILDEATSALDNESEALVQDALEKLMVGRTTFIIAHRLSTVRRAERILVLDRGEVVQDGNHQELYAQNGPYRELYDLQFRV